MMQLAPDGANESGGGVYGASPVKRQRRTQAELDKLRAQIHVIVKSDHPMTVRQVFYQMEVKHLVEKSELGYELIQRELLGLRRNGTIPYSWIADNTRRVLKPKTFSSKEDALDHTARFYRRALWDNQDAYVEVWCEKDALSGVISPETSKYDVPLMVTRGFSSETFLYQAAEAINESGKPAFIYYFGDHDPSGTLIDPHIRNSLGRLAPEADITLKRVAVTPDQIEDWDLPTRPTKRGKNSHARDFQGDSVELDAIPPAQLRGLVRGCIEQHIDQHALEITKVAEQSEREIFARLAKGFRNDGPKAA